MTFPLQRFLTSCVYCYPKCPYPTFSEGLSRAKVKDEKEVNLYEPPRYYAHWPERNMQIYFDNILIRTRWVTSEVLVTIRISEFFEAYTWIEQTKLDQPEDKCNRIWSNFRLIFEDWTKNENYLWSHFRIQREGSGMKSNENDTNLTSCCLGSMICRKTKTSALAVDESFFFFAFLFSIFNQELTTIWRMRIASSVANDICVLARQRKCPRNC